MSQPASQFAQPKPKIAISPPDLDPWGLLAVMKGDTDSPLLAQEPTSSSASTTQVPSASQPLGPAGHPASPQSSAPSASENLHVHSASHEVPPVQPPQQEPLREVVKWGSVRDSLVKAIRGPYSLEARVATRSLNMGFPGVLSFPREVMWSTDSFACNPMGSMWDLSWPEHSSTDAMDTAEPPDQILPIFVANPKPWKGSVVHSKGWSDAIDANRSQALEIWKSLILSSGSATKVGRDLLRAQEDSLGEAKVRQIIDDVFAKRASSTLRTRSTSMLQFIRWRSSVGLETPPFPIDESEAYDYICFLRSEGAPKSKAPRFREAANFCGALLGFDFDDISQSARIDGACIGTVFKPVQKCDPLTAVQVQSLEEQIYDLPDLEAVLVGFCLYVLHGRLRWSDAQCTESEPVLDSTESGCGYLIANLYHHKTADKNSLLRHRLLPVSCISPGLSTHCWASEWLRRRARLGLRAARGVPLMPCPLNAGGFDTIPLDASRGAIFLREILGQLGHAPVLPQRIRTHSLKTTILSWMAKAASSENLRSVAGYHVGKSRSTLEYDRDSLAPVMHHLEGLFQLIRLGIFSPDCTRSGRWTGRFKSVDLALASLQGDRPDGEGEAPDAFSDVEEQSEVHSQAGDPVSDEEFAEGLQSVQQLAARIPVETPALPPQVFMHKTSKVFHIPRADHPSSEGEITILVCGRTANVNYELVPMPTICVAKCSGCWASR